MAIDPDDGPTLTIDDSGGPIPAWPADLEATFNWNYKDGHMVTEAKEKKGKAIPVEVVGQDEPSTAVAIPEGIQHFEFKDGNWWQAKTVVTQRLRDMINVATFTGVNLEGALDASQDIGEEKVIQKALMQDYGKAIKAELNAEHARLEYGTVAWSFDAPITLASILDLPEKYVAPVADWMREAYAALTESELKN